MIRKKNEMWPEMVWWCEQRRTSTKRGRKDDSRVLPHIRVLHHKRSIVDQLSKSGRLKQSGCLSRNKSMSSVTQSPQAVSCRNHFAPFILKGKPIYYAYSWMPSPKKNSTLFAQFTFSWVFNWVPHSLPSGRTRGQEGESAVWEWERRLKQLWDLEGTDGEGGCGEN